MNHLQRPVAVFSTCRNALSIYLGRIFGIEVKRVSLWNGVQFTVENTNNNLGTILEVFHEREYGDLVSLRTAVSPTIIDIGANIGTFTVWAGKELPTATIHAYEPEAKNHLLLVKNIELNGLTARATATQSAVGGERGVRTLSIAGESSGKNSLSYDVGSGVSVEVTCTTLDDIFNEHSIARCDCLKLDCEGSEYEILYKTATQTIERISLIIFEWHSVQGESVEELVLFLEKHGFQVTRSLHFSNMATARRIN